MMDQNIRLSARVQELLGKCVAAIDVTHDLNERWEASVEVSDVDLDMHAYFGTDRLLRD